ncbi:DUF4381 family protein [Vibrio alginolyticus]
MILPNAPDWFPLAWGWWVVLAATLLFVFGICLYVKKNTYAQKRQH